MWDRLAIPVLGVKSKLENKLVLIHDANDIIESRRRIPGITNDMANFLVNPFCENGLLSKKVILAGRKQVGDGKFDITGLKLNEDLFGLYVSLKSIGGIFRELNTLNIMQNLWTVDRG